MIDPRGPRAAAWLTTAVLAAVLLLGDTRYAGPLLAAQAVVFALGAGGASPYVLAWKRLVRPRLGPPAELEDPRPPRFAQLVGLAFAAVGAVAFLTGLTVLAYAATAAALAAAFLNAAFGVCLGCELYLTFKKLTATDNPREGATA